MIDFLAKFFRREEASSSRARERLRLVLMSDRVSLAPDIFDAMKGEMLDVLRRYLEIDERGMDVHFENAERQFALMANIPVREVKTHDAIALARRVAVPEGAEFTSAKQTASADAANGSAAQQATMTVPRRRRRRRARTAAIAPLASQPNDDAGTPQSNDDAGTPQPNDDAGAPPPSG
ncbi:MAG TPA: cell division topological specificity factor MinE [Candidatus Eremiobacteraceae bacterium]|nr:cell division topological specificity factor MinE [Candidatus Eremiobacteraceae bacterium]